MSDCEQVLKDTEVELLNVEELLAFIQRYTYLQDTLDTENQARVLV